MRKCVLVCECVCVSTEAPTLIDNGGSCFQPEWGKYGYTFAYGQQPENSRRGQILPTMKPRATSTPVSTTPATTSTSPLTTSTSTTGRPTSSTTGTTTTTTTSGAGSWRYGGGFKWVRMPGLTPSAIFLSWTFVTVLACYQVHST